MTDRLIYVCSPYAGDVVGNTERARIYSRYVVDSGFVPVTPHLLYPLFVDEDTERLTGLFCGTALLCKCDELWYFGDRISEGMAAEIKKAELLGLPVRHIKG